MKIKERIEYVEREIVNLQKAIKLLKKLKGGETNLPLNVDVTTLDGGRILFTGISEMKSVYLVRAWLKEILGSWEDKLRTIWYSSGVMIASFEGKDIDIEFWLQTHPEHFPEELQSDKCKVVKMPDEVSPRYDYICSTE